MCTEFTPADVTCSFLNHMGVFVICYVMTSQ